MMEFLACRFSEQHNKHNKHMHSAFTLNSHNFFLCQTHTQERNVHSRIELIMLANDIAGSMSKWHYVHCYQQLEYEVIKTMKKNEHNQPLRQQ